MTRLIDTANSKPETTLNDARLPTRRCSMARLAGLLVLLAIAIAATHAGPSARAQDAQNDVAALLQRIEQLEEQIVDLQVAIGTLQSQPQTSQALPPAGAPAGFGAQDNPVDAGRLSGMETQIGALTAQVQQLANRLRQLDGGGQRGALTAPPAAPPGNGAQPASGVPGDAAPAQPSFAGTIPGFGATTVEPAATNTQPQRVATAPSGSDPKKIYETAYGYVLQQDYGAAEAAFRDFLTAYPTDPLAGNAQYWLGETYFVRGQYKKAADAFLKGSEDYANGAKASDSLLRLAMSLDRLGHAEAACRSLSRLLSQFPNAPAHVKRNATRERSRLRC